MKKYIIMAILKVLTPVSGYTQNSVQQKLIFPEKITITSFSRPASTSFTYSIAKFIDIEGPGNSLLSFRNGQPIVKLPGSSNRSSLIFAEISYPDLVENTINSVNAGLINTYDDQISELFKDAPSLFKVKCIIFF